jgi:hypothetical protein
MSVGHIHAIDRVATANGPAVLYWAIFWAYYTVLITPPHENIPRIKRSILQNSVLVDNKALPIISIWKLPFES